MSNFLIFGTQYFLYLSIILTSHTIEQQVQQLQGSLTAPQIKTKSSLIHLDAVVDQPLPVS